MAVKVAVYGTADMRQIDKAQKELDKLRKSAEVNSGGVQGAMAKAEARFKSFGSAVTSASGILTGLAATAVVSFGKDCVEAFAESERVTKNLELAVENAGISWDVYGTQIQSAIDAQSALSRDDEELASAMTTLIRMTKDQGEATRLLAVANDLSRMTGQDLGASATLLGKVYNGNISVLKRYGITVRDGATATEALAQIQAMSAGAAAEYSDTTAGKIEAMSVAWGNFKEQLGGTFGPAITDALKWFTDWLADDEVTIQDVKQEWGEFLGIIPEKAPEAAESTRDLSAATYDAAAAAEAEADAVERLVRGLDGQLVAEDSLEGRQRSAQEASIAKRQADIDLAQAQEAYNEAVKRHGKNSDEAKEAELRLESATLRAKDATVDFNAASAAVIGITPAWQEAMNQRIKKLDSLRVSADLAADELDRIYGAGSGDATRAAANYGGLDGDRNIPGYAEGGIVSRPTYALVGEAGPEVILPLSDPRRSAQLMQQAGIGTANLSVTINVASGDPNAIASAVSAEMKKLVRNSYALGRV